MKGSKRIEGLIDSSDSSEEPKKKKKTEPKYFEKRKNEDLSSSFNKKVKKGMDLSEFRTKRVKPSVIPSKEKEWHIGRNRMVSVRKFKNQHYVDIREFYLKDQELRPGKKGIFLKLEEFLVLAKFAPEIKKHLEDQDLI